MSSIWKYVMVLILGVTAIPFSMLWRFVAGKLSGALRSAVSIALFFAQLAFLLSVVLFAAPALLDASSPSYEYVALIVLFSGSYVICASIFSRSTSKK